MARSYSDEDDSTLPGSAWPEESLTVTDTLLWTTCWFVMTVRGPAKNPLPRPSPVSIDTIAGIDRLMTSSRLGTSACAGPTTSCGGVMEAPAAGEDAPGRSTEPTAGPAAKSGKAGAVEGASAGGSTRGADLTELTCRATSVPAATTATTPSATHEVVDEIAVAAPRRGGSASSWGSCSAPV